MPLQDAQYTFRARDLLIERSPVQQPPINLEVGAQTAGMGRRRRPRPAAPHSALFRPQRSLRHGRALPRHAGRRPHLLPVPGAGAGAGGTAFCRPAGGRRPNPTPFAALPPTPLQDLKFGTVFTDHMFHVEHVVGQGWGRPAVKPFGLLQVHPAAQVLHYGLCCFEGMKAYAGVDGRTRLFRPELNMARLRRSARRLQLADFDPQVGCGGKGEEMGWSWWGRASCGAAASVPIGRYCLPRTITPPALWWCAGSAISGSASGRGGGSAGQPPRRVATLPRAARPRRSCWRA